MVVPDRQARMTVFVSSGVAIGIAIGMVLSLVLGSWAFIGVGVALGAGIAATLVVTDPGRRKDPPPP